MYKQYHIIIIMTNYIIAVNVQVCNEGTPSRESAVWFVIQTIGESSILNPDVQ